MKIKITLFVLAWLLLAFLSRDVQGQKTPQTIEFDKLSDFVNEYSKRRNGQRLVVNEVPVVEEITYEKAYRMYLFKPDPDGGVGNMFFTSATLAKALRRNLNSRAVLMTITCVLIEFESSHDVYRSPFATKIEGVNMDGDIVWTVTGPPPAKLKFK